MNSNMLLAALLGTLLFHFAAIVDCDASVLAAKYTGYEVELFRSSAAYLYANGRAEWAPDNYTFTCMGWDGLMEDLLLDPVNRTCDVGVAGISATSDRIAEGARAWHPSHLATAHVWPFDRSVWLLMFATSLLVGLSVMLAEVPLSRIWNRPGPSLTKYSNLQWAASAMLLQATSTFSAKSTGARIIILGWGFMILILINMCVAGRVGRLNGYIAVLASQLTVNSINMNINGINDLISKPLGIFEADLTAFKRFNLAFLVPLPWNNAEVGELAAHKDEEVMKESLRSGKVSALALDAPFVEYNVAQSCNFFTVGDIVLPVNLAYAFPPDTMLDHVEYFNQALTVMSETGTMEALQKQFITPEGGCSNKASGSATTVITVNQVAGLWVFFGAAIAAGAVINIGWYLWKKCCCRGEEEEGGVLGSSPSMRNNSLAGSMSMGSMAGGKSFARANPQMAWLGVAEATTHEEAMQVMEGHVRLVDMHLKRLTEQIDSRFAALSENLATGDVRPLPAPQPSAPPNLRQKSLSARLSKLLTFTKSGSGVVEAGPSHATLQLTPSLRRGDGDQATAPAPPSLTASDAPPAQPPSGAPHSAPGSLPDGSAALPASLVPAGPASTELMALTDPTKGTKAIKGTKAGAGQPRPNRHHNQAAMSREDPGQGYEQLRDRAPGSSSSSSSSGSGSGSSGSSGSSSSGSSGSSGSRSLWHIAVRAVATSYKVTVEHEGKSHVLHVPEGETVLSVALDQDVAEKGYVLMCVATPTSDCSITTISEDELLTQQFGM
ncbi:hypothetical protein QJQ45_007692 [Haematococcus lacustris]|nr:hypothetical protein QJQ45_007692 [Haematococcus lacustris]